MRASDWTTDFAFFFFLFFLGLGLVVLLGFGVLDLDRDFNLDFDLKLYPDFDFDLNFFVNFVNEQNEKVTDTIRSLPLLGITLHSMLSI